MADENEKKDALRKEIYELKRNSPTPNIVKDKEDEISDMIYNQYSIQHNIILGKALASSIISEDKKVNCMFITRKEMEEILGNEDEVEGRRWLHIAQTVEGCAGYNLDSADVA